MKMFLNYVDVRQQILSNLLNTDLQENKSKIPVNWSNNFVSNTKIIILSKIPDTAQDLIKNLSLNEDIIKTVFANLTLIKEDLFRKDIRHGQKINKSQNTINFVLINN